MRNRNISKLKTLALTSAISLLVLVPSFSSAAHAANTASKTFGAGTSSSFTVPAGVTSLDLTLIGGNGAAGTNELSGRGGNGAKVKATISVTPGQSLNIHVGGNASSPNGGANGGGNGGFFYNFESQLIYGGGGGGASDIRVGGDALENRIAVAAGGGGGAASGNLLFDEASPAEGGSGANYSEESGGTGENSPASIEPSDSVSPQSPAISYGGQSAIGADGGLGGEGRLNGDDGSLGQGGLGANGFSSAYNCGLSTTSGCDVGDAVAPSSVNGDGGAGGGGGAGYAGGGGGAGGYSGGGGGGGGAGSSYVAPSLTNASIVGNSGASPSVTIEYVAIPTGAYGSNLSDTTQQLNSSPGGKVTVHGMAFAPNSDVLVELHSKPVKLGTARTDSAGNFVQVFSIPKNASIGNHQIVLIGKDGNGNNASAVLSLRLALLPATGASSTASNAITAFTLLLTGAGLLLLRKKMSTKIS